MALSFFNLGAYLFDLDGVLTSSASAHEEAWKQTFDEVLSDLNTRGDASLRLFRDDDYRRHVDGKARADGVRGFLASRGITLPVSDRGGASRWTISGIARFKNERFEEILAGGAITAFPGSVALVRALRAKGLHTAVVSASRHCVAILEATGIDELFDVRIDGEAAARLGLAGKPAPDTFLAAASALGVDPRRAAVFEDAIAGVEAGHAGAFGLVIGVARGQHRDELLEHGADLVVSDLSELLECQGA